MYPFSLFKIVQILTPAAKRTPRFIAWLKVFVSYLQYILEDFYQFRDRSIKEAIMTPQIIMIEWLLNTRYGTTKIKIIEGYSLGPWIYPRLVDVLHEFYLDQTNSFVYSNQDAVTVDFVVDVPESLSSETSTIAALVQKYKLPGKTFIIQLIED